MDFKIDELWAEELALLFLVIGFIFSILIKNPFLNYLTILLSGLVAGRVYYFKYRQEPIFAFVLIIAGFLAGYLIGGLWVSRIAALILFGLGLTGSYYLHHKKILVMFKSKSFIK